MQTILNYELYLLIESFTLILVSGGILALRIYLSDFMNSDESFNEKQTLTLMVGTVFSFELLVIISIIYFVFSPAEDVLLEFALIKSLIIFPRLLFYGILCYFFYWLIRFFQKKQDLYRQIKTQYEEMSEFIDNEHRKKNDSIKD